ncbi:hypothetical protein [Sinorhizobium chiapasense]|uniref:Uncharacterized protein n=1 Tax=Sinorhizobium chiapasense TaxID=501572 RepID=A0ABZ2B4M8_9HYPH
MIQALKTAIQVIWVVLLVTMATTFGAIYGWEHHGWGGAIALGFVGFFAAAFIASSPALLLQILT